MNYFSLSEFLKIWNQFPTQFEFNEYYLRFLAYHHLSNRFKNFMLDCDCERKKDRNWYVDTTRDPIIADDVIGKQRISFIQPTTTFSLSLSRSGLYRCNTINIWDYINKLNRECARFYNFLYCPSNDNCVLRPSYKMYSLDVWDFYLSETLETGCPYDLDIATAEHDEHLNDAELRQRSKCISAVYDDISLCLPNFFNEIVSEMSNTLSYTNGDLWKTYWDKIDKPEREKAQVRDRSFSSQQTSKIDCFSVCPFKMKPTNACIFHRIICKLNVRYRRRFLHHELRRSMVRIRTNLFNFLLHRFVMLAMN